jgi:alkaline phosphatase
MERSTKWRAAVPLIAVGLAVALLAPATAAKPPPKPAAGPKNIIIFIGDGMGPEQVRIGQVYKKADTGQSLHINSSIPWQAKGTLNTNSLDGITDSAAGATALATGYETLNGWVGMIPPEPGTPVESALEQAEDVGKATGLVTSVGMTNATPASFAAHVSDRGEDDEIAAMMAAQGSEVLMGAGQDDPLLNQPGVTYVDNVTDIQAYAAGTGAGPLYALMGVESLAHPIDRENEGVVGIEPTLSQMTTAALDILSADPQGFFLMVEDGAIDWAGHSRDGAWTATDMIQMDDAVKAAYDWAKNRTDTLIVVTADHECCGLSFTTKGPNAIDIDGLLGQTASVEFMWGELKTQDWTKDAVVKALVEKYTTISPTQAEIDHVQYVATLGSGEMGLADVLSDRWNVNWLLSGLDEGDHTDTPVPIYAWGPKSADFAGTAYANERVGQLLLSYLGA